MLYLNGTYRLAPDQLDVFAAGHEARLAPALERLGIAPLGLWQTWQTNELVDLWEVGEWAILDRLDQAGREDPALTAYLREANRQRQSSSVRILRPTPFCPDLARIKSEGLKGGVYLFATIPIVPERLSEYLELFPRHGMRLEEKHGLRTVGYWTGGGADQSEAFNCTQLCVIEDWAAWGRFTAARAADPEVAEWMRRALFYRTFHRSRFLVPRWLPY